MTAIRYRVDPRDVPATKAARRLGLTLGEFNEHLPMLLARTFPPADPTTGHYDLKAIEAWQDARHSLTNAAQARDPGVAVDARTTFYANRGKQKS